MIRATLDIHSLLSFTNKLCCISTVSVNSTPVKNPQMKHIVGKIMYPKKRRIGPRARLNAWLDNKAQENSVFRLVGVAGIKVVDNTGTDGTGGKMALRQSV